MAKQEAPLTVTIVLRGGVLPGLRMPVDVADAIVAAMHDEGDAETRFTFDHHQLDLRPSDILAVLRELPRRLATGSVAFD